MADGTAKMLVPVTMLVWKIEPTNGRYWVNRLLVSNSNGDVTSLDVRRDGAITVSCTPTFSSVYSNEGNGEHWWTKVVP